MRCVFIALYFYPTCIEEKPGNTLVKCVNCDKETFEDHYVSCDMCGAVLSEECGTIGLFSTCAELWEAEIDLEDMEAEE